MKLLLTTDKRVALYGTKKQIQEAEQILIKNISNMSALNEPDARLKIQDCIDTENLKADILFSGNTVWNKNKILKDIRAVKKYGMEKLSDYLYKFLSLSCGSIAHYNKQGWISVYPIVYDLRLFFVENEYGQRVLNFIPTWKTDAYRIVEEIEQVLGV